MYPELVALIEAVKHTIASGAVYAGLEDALDAIERKLNNEERRP